MTMGFIGIITVLDIMTRNSEGGIRWIRRISLIAHLSIVGIKVSGEPKGVSQYTKLIR